MSFLAQLTGISTLVIVGVVFILADLVMLVVITPLVHLLPRSRLAILGAWAQLMARFSLAVIHHVGGARIDPVPGIPCHGGVLMVMNHQSLIDIPLAARCVAPGYPRMVARARYGRGIPLVSHMISLYGHIPVQPGRMGRSELEALAETARASTLPILIYPEGHRTRDGEIGPWKRAGLDTFLSAREWDVYVVVVDGLWRVARLSDFVRNLSRVRGRAATVGPFRYDGRGRENHDEFVSELRRVMVKTLADRRAAGSTSRTDASLVSSGK